MRAAVRSRCASSPNENARMAPTVEWSRWSRAHREWENPLCSATPAATIGWAIWSRIARPHPSTTTRSRLTRWDTSMPTV